MQIGISTSVIQRGKSGVGQYVFAVVRALLDQPGDHKLVLFVLAEDISLFDFARGKVKLVTVPEEVRPAAKNIAWHHSKLPGLARGLKLDVLHIPSYRRLLWSRPCALVATIHDLAPFHLKGKYDWKRMFYGRVVVKRLARRQNEIICISRNTASDITRFFGLPEERLTVIHNGIDHSRFYPGSKVEAQKEVAAKWGLQKPFFLYVARIEHPAKNHLRLVRAFERFKTATGSDWQLALGGSDWHGAEVVHQAIDRSSFAHDIKRLGFVADEILPQLYRAADVFVYPSLFEGFGLPPVEAMACGCPVISSTRGALEEVVGDAAAIVDPENVDAMAVQLKAAASEPALRSRLAEAGLKRAALFDWNRAAAQTLKVYERAAKNRA